MPRNLSIRRFEPRDADAVWNVHEAALRASPLAFVEEATVDENVTEIKTHYLDADGEFLVGTLAGEVVAIGGYAPVGERTVEISRMRVAPEHQWEGYVRRILEELERRARDDGFEAVVLETAEPLQAARALYEDAGYEVAKTTEDDVTGVERHRYRTEL